MVGVVAGTMVGLVEGVLAPMMKAIISMSTSRQSKPSVSLSPLSSVARSELLALVLRSDPSDDDDDADAEDDDDGDGDDDDDPDVEDGGDGRWTGLMRCGSSPCTSRPASCEGSK